ncbi:hypothetical protein GWK47_038055 [Chionoecetes opilio]|uniref:Uncharacterized protein n=1 Tax=Chionoecetes opilio TaxID=41210 RepID=A0A8J5D217_CHIOP|nr:hypothetical protein GWK47_038055 [Chionoecetes opilio]
MDAAEMQGQRSLATLQALGHLAQRPATISTWPYTSLLRHHKSHRYPVRQHQSLWRQLADGCILLPESHKSLHVHGGPAQCHYSIHAKNEWESKMSRIDHKHIHVGRCSVVQMQTHDPCALAKVLLTTHCKDPDDLLLP